MYFTFPSVERRQVQSYPTTCWSWRCLVGSVFKADTPSAHEWGVSSHQPRVSVSSSHGFASFSSARSLQILLMGWMGRWLGCFFLDLGVGGGFGAAFGILLGAQGKPGFVYQIGRPPKEPGGRRTINQNPVSHEDTHPRTFKVTVLEIPR